MIRILLLKNGRFSTCVVAVLFFKTRLYDIMQASTIFGPLGYGENPQELTEQTKDSLLLYRCVFPSMLTKSVDPT